MSFRRRSAPVTVLLHRAAHTSPPHCSTLYKNISRTPARVNDKMDRPAETDGSEESAHIRALTPQSRSDKHDRLDSPAQTLSQCMPSASPALLSIPLKKTLQGAAVSYFYEFHTQWCSPYKVIIALSQSLKKCSGCG
ncbi:hypothetical protein BDW22DRAFT_1433080 [Trametopsis cervina]|nr:hypothetical protein BDW22DRAFT_1433080 [Trametopsis cervina]